MLDQLGAILGQLDNAIRVEGHTDNIPLGVGEFASNWELSTARATAVLRYFVDGGTLAPERIHAAGFAEFRPIADNGAAEGRAQNRRADVVSHLRAERGGGGAGVAGGGAIRRGLRGCWPIPRRRK